PTPIAVQLADLKPRVAALAELNARYKVCAMYHTHSGANLVGAPIWDLYILLKDFDPNAVSVNYDIGHATLEGGLGGWIDSFRIVEPMLRGIAVKDCVWRPVSSGNWKSEFVPLGTGMVHLAQFVGMVAQTGFNGPLQLHFEYPLGGAENGKAKLTIPKEQVFAAMKRDLAQLRSFLSQAG
ncbi:MAG: sugar phosphate isomerase/epimerase, partial [Acidobacteriota bacterium]|nr:sugar phosphate isomerase/epimerase [Acidobacteriota bacterium]